MATPRIDAPRPRRHGPRVRATGMILEQAHLRASRATGSDGPRGGPARAGGPRRLDGRASARWTCPRSGPSASRERRRQRPPHQCRQPVRRVRRAPRIHASPAEPDGRSAVLPLALTPGPAAPGARVMRQAIVGSGDLSIRRRPDPSRQVRSTSVEWQIRASPRRRRGPRPRPSHRRTARFSELPTVLRAAPGSRERGFRAAVPID